MTLAAQPQLFETGARSAAFCRRRIYRYTLWRRWSDGRRYVQFICLNPSTADEHSDDPTIRKCIKFAKSWGFDAMCMTNLFAYRATNPMVMKKALDPIGFGNDRWILKTARGASMIVAAWSQHGVHLNRGSAVRGLLQKFPLHYLRVTPGSQPWHPLYLPDATRPSLWTRD